MIKNEMVLRKTNELIQKFAVDVKSTTESDIFDYMIANITSTKYDKEFNAITFSIVDFFKYTYDRKPSGDDYKDFKKAVEGLANRSVWGIVEKGEYANCETLLRLIERPYINPKTGQVTLRLDDNLKPYLLDFAEKPYTRMLYLTKAALSTKYIKRLYEILKSYENMASGIWPPIGSYLDIDEFKKMLNVPESYLAGNIKKRILEPAKQEIEEKTDISFVYRERKEGNKIVGYQFRIFKQKDKLDKAPPLPGRKKKEVLEESIEPIEPEQIVIEEVLEDSPIPPEEPKKKILDDDWRETETDSYLLNNPYEVEQARGFSRDAFDDEFDIMDVIELAQTASPIFQNINEKYTPDDIFDMDSVTYARATALVEKTKYLRRKYVEARKRSTQPNGLFGYLKKLIEADGEKLNNGRE